jgi:hypothetical protein
MLGVKYTANSADYPAGMVNDKRLPTARPDAAAAATERCGGAEEVMYDIQTFRFAETQRHVSRQTVLFSSENTAIKQTAA